MRLTKIMPPIHPGETLREDFLKPLTAELDHFMELEHILRMAKAKARQILARGQ